MVKVKEHSHLLADGTIDVHAWLAHLSETGHYPDVSVIRSACLLSELAGQDTPTETDQSCFQQGLTMAEILVDLELDAETLAAAIIYSSAQYTELTNEDIQEALGKPIAKLVTGIARMNASHNMQQAGSASNHQQIDNMRKMLLSMVDDARVVLIKLAERLAVLRNASHLPAAQQRTISQEVSTIYAPLANRLGVGHMKWELEDLAFRYADPEQYKTIAKGLNLRRVERDRYVHYLIDTLSADIKASGIKDFNVYGRSKHIHSIYNKMQRKNISLDKIYDSTAVRVLLSKIEDCYQVLSLVHQRWKQIPEEFDDYISNPKSNGYRSLHTAVLGENNQHFEVQIRTQQMHDQAELGVAAHWKYKEGSGAADSHERKINWLREVLAWHKEVAATEGIPDEVENEFLEDRIYIFTPKGDVLDLPKGSTPLDFAYQIHSEVGHRCRGAKVNGRIVTLNYVLQTGEQVDVLTGKEAKPSRDWLNPHTGYLHNPRSKAKVHHWFKQQDYDKHKEMGHHILERELTKLHIKDVDYTALAKQFNLKQSDDLLAAVGCGDIRVNQLVTRLTPKIQEEKHIIAETPTLQPQKFASGDIQISGVGNLLTHLAKCCHPVPGDAIIGYVTLGKGISIHRQDCNNVLHLYNEKRERFIEVNWQEHSEQSYPVNVIIKAYDRPGLLKDITVLISNEKANVLNLNVNTSSTEHAAYVKASVEINSLQALSRLLDKLKQLPNIVEVKRVD